MGGSPKEFPIGHLTKEKKIEGKDEDVLFARVCVTIYNLNTMDKHYRSYGIRIRFMEVFKFSQLKDKKFINTNYVRSSDRTYWEMKLSRNEILPEINRLRSHGFKIEEDRVNDLTSEFV